MSGLDDWFHYGEKMFMMRLKRLLALALTCLLGAGVAWSQEALLSVSEQYYDFLALNGAVERPYLNYRTLSDSAWDLKESGDQPWVDQKLDSWHALSGEARFRIYGPELFSSFNSAAPYGQNDGLLWQGKGLNASLTGGLRFEGWGFELTFKPQIAFSQNTSFEIMTSAYESEYGYIWSYGAGAMVDAPQRFGDDLLAAFSWGDSEIRYTWKALTVGAGTQSIWLGPAKINPLMHSNNAVPYPKLDAGIRRMPLNLFGWYSGEIEARLWAGRLAESDFFDSNPDNDHRLISGLSVAYAPGFIPGLSLFANRTFLADWKPENALYIPELFLVSLRNSEQVQGAEDQRAGLGFSYLLPEAGFEVYGELALDDYVAGTNGYIRYPFHTIAYTAGMAKAFELQPTEGVYGLLSAEFHTSEMSQDFQFQWPSTFYGHHQIAQGYTSGGQWLGPGSGTGGNAQYLDFSIFYPRGRLDAFVYRINPDNDYLYKDSVQQILTTTDGASAENFYRFKASFSMGIEGEYQLNEWLLLSGGFVYDYVVNPLYEASTYQNNFRVTLGATVVGL